MHPVPGDRRALGRFVHRQFRPDRPDRLWVQDVTQHRHQARSAGHGFAERMTTPATPSKRAARKAAPTPKPAAKSSAKLVVVPEPATKTSKRATKSVAVETKPERVNDAASPSAAELIVKHEEMLAAIDAFESLVIVEVTAGVSPTAIGKLIGLGNSSVRRICMRRSPGLVK
jgi:hypothetical protein